MRQSRGLHTSESSTCSRILRAREMTARCRESSRQESRRALPLLFHVCECPATPPAINHQHHSLTQQATNLVLSCSSLPPSLPQSLVMYLSLSPSVSLSLCLSVSPLSLSTRLHPCPAITTMPSNLSSSPPSSLLHSRTHLQLKALLCPEALQVQCCFISLSMNGECQQGGLAC